MIWFRLNTNHKTYSKNEPTTVENSFELLILNDWFLEYVLMITITESAMTFIHKTSLNQLKFALLRDYES